MVKTWLEKFEWDWSPELIAQLEAWLEATAQHMPSPKTALSRTLQKIKESGKARALATYCLFTVGGPV